MPPTAWASQPLADTTIPKPPPLLTDPDVAVLPQGTMLHRVHDTSLGATQFNPGIGRSTRFAPFNSNVGAIVPSLYASNALKAAIHEAIFHDIPAGCNVKTVPLTAVKEKTHSTFSTLRDLRLVELRNVPLNRWGISRSELISSGPGSFDGTVLWAEAIHRDVPGTDGLVWTSSQCDPDDAYLFFGDRVHENDFKAVQSRDGRNDISFNKDVRNEGNRRGMALTV